MGIEWMMDAGTAIGDCIKTCVRINFIPIVLQIPRVHI